MRYSLFLLLFSIFLFSQTIEDDFEGNGTISSSFGDDCVISTEFSNLYKEGINTSNTVLKYSDTGVGFVNVRFDVPINFNLSDDYTFSLKIYVSSNDITGAETNQISLKLQEGKIGAPWSTQSKLKTFLIEEKTKVVDFSSFKKGVYFLKLESTTKVATFKLIKH